MKLIVQLLACASLFLGTAAHAQDDKDIGNAQAAAQHWLALADAGQRAATWTEAAEPFQRAVTQADWEQTLQTVRAPLGALKSRTLKTSRFLKNPPGAPDGDYVMVTYDSVYANQPAVTETVTQVRGKDGSWKMSGYFIR